MTAFETIAAEVRGIVDGPGSADDRLQAVCDLLREQVAHYDWVGFYLVDPRATRELVLGPYAGAATDHDRIPFGRGICGQAAESGETFVVPDVSAESNYLSCSIDVRSEIVVPVFVASTGGAPARRLVGELDIDSHQTDPFGDGDRRLLEGIAGAVGALCDLRDRG